MDGHRQVSCPRPTTVAMEALYVLLPLRPKWTCDVTYCLLVRCSTLHLVHNISNEGFLNKKGIVDLNLFLKRLKLFCLIF